MASPQAADLESLTPEQQEIVQQYVQVTDQNIEEAIALLQRSQWNIQVRRPAHLPHVYSSHSGLCEE